MKVTISYGPHPRREGPCFSTTVKIGQRGLTQYSHTRLTKRQVRELKREARVRNKIPFGYLGRHHDETCLKCKNKGFGPFCFL
ncbi:hypothetical protein [Serratia phage vB_SspM_LC53]|nr:hypothetical protein [Serratia phage vB_SspM_LC53]